MPRFDLSERAEAVLLEIYEDSVTTFGAYQEKAYQAGLRHIFELLASFPGIGRFADELKPGFRRYRCESHHIFCTNEEDRIFIRTLIHTSRQLKPDLFEWGSV